MKTFVFDFLSEGWTPTSLRVPNCVSREDVQEALSLALDGELSQSWAGLADMMRYQDISSYLVRFALFSLRVCCSSRPLMNSR